MSSLKRVLVAAGALAGIAATFSLGVWQWGRAQQKLALQAAIEQRMALPPVDAAALLDAQPAALVHRPAALKGQWEPRHTVYLDNRQMNGRPGFYVLTPLRLAGRAEAILVQRGWVPRDFTQRDRLAPVDTPPGEVSVAGRVAPPPAQLYAFDRAERGVIRQNLDLAQFRQETGLALLPVTLQQTGAPSEGLLREWPVAASGADKNYGYAFQWWALAGLIALLYVWFQFIAPRRAARRA